MAEKPSYEELELSVKEFERKAFKRDQKEKAMGKHLKGLKQAQRIAWGGTWEVDFKTNTFIASEERMRIYGFDGNFTGTVSMGEFFQHIHPKDRERFASALQNAITGKSQFDQEFQIIRMDGEIRIIHALGEVFREDSGEPLCLTGTAIDITEHKHMEESLRQSEAQKKAILDASIDRIRLVDKDMKIIWANKTTARELKITPEELVGKFCYRVFVGEDSACPECPTTKALKSGNLEHAILHKITSKIFKEEKYWDNYAVPIKNESGDIVNYIQINRDITKQVKAEEEKKKLEAQLHQAQKMETLGTLVSGIAHEINNPINLIMLNLPLLQKVWHDFLPIMREHTSKEPNRKYGGLTYDFLQENLITLISDMEMASDQVANTVMDLKTFAKQSNIADKQQIQIHASVENAVRLAQSAIKELGIDLEIDMAHDLPLMSGNSQSIEQIVLNLLMNAVQAIDHNQGKVTIKTEFQKKNKRIVLSISDNGRGIDPTVSDKIFEPFFTDKQAEGGTGLGLSITCNLVNVHQGKITFKSKKGKGTTFIVSFPTMVKRKAAKILVVDDDKPIRDFLTEILSREQIYQVDEAVNGIEACMKLGTFYPDLLILDIFMPEMDGCEVLRTIQTKPELSDMQVIITTGFPDHPKLKEAAEMGFTNIYIKPIKLADILKGVDTVLNRESKE